MKIESKAGERVRRKRTAGLGAGEGPERRFSGPFADRFFSARPDVRDISMVSVPKPSRGEARKK